MTTTRKILCAIDLTKASHNAFDRALSIARASKARLYILHALPANYPLSWHRSERLKLLTSLRERAEREGVPVRTVEQHGDPARTIVLHANARKADLVVLGSNRRRGWQRFRERSVGERVLRRVAACGSTGKTVPVMHACGHDMHVTWLIGAVTVLAETREKAAVVEGEGKITAMSREGGK